MLRNCNDCGATPGNLHDLGCDVERCSQCGHQLISCDCSVCDEDSEESSYTAAQLENRLPWSGEWPFNEACREFGFYCYWGNRLTKEPQDSFHPDNPGTWVPCAADHPNATEDLNRLYTFGVWNKEERKWTIKSKQN